MSVKYSVQQMGRSHPIKRPKWDYSNQVSDWRSQDKVWNSVRNKLRQNVCSENTQTSDSTFACQIKTRLRPNPQPQGMVERGMGRFRQRLTELN